MNRLVLHYSPRSTASQRVLLFVAEHAIAIDEHETVDLMRLDHLEPAFLALNPAATIPVLVDGEQIVCGSLAICRYLATRVAIGKTELSRESAALIDALDAADCLRVLTYQRRFVPLLAAPEGAALLAKARTHPSRGAWYQSIGQAGFEEVRLAQARREGLDLMRRLNAHLGARRGWFEDSFGVADIAIVPLVHRGLALGLFADHEFKYLLDWYRRFEQRDSFKRVLAPL